MAILKFQQSTDHAVAIATVATEAHDIAALAADYQQSRGHRKETLKTTLSAKLDGLLGFMMGTFHGVPSHQMVQDCLLTQHPLTEARLGTLDQRILPLVVVRELISFHDVPVDRRLLTNWNEFSERYRGSVL
jgi:hypothetical protein